MCDYVSWANSPLFVMLSEAKDWRDEWNHACHTCGRALPLDAQDDRMDGATRPA